MAARIGRVLDRLDASIRPEDMNLPDYRFHGPRGGRSGTYAASVSGNVRITFAFDGENPVDVDFEDYH
ncbi:MAG TPA: peptidase [Casimicrobiaceae bacterium]|nr:peptidase [Casimicrobiaceae bacterium]